MIVSAILARSSGVSRIWLSGKSQNCTSSTPTMAADRRCSLFTQRPGLLGRHARDAVLAAARQRIMHGLARAGPLGDRRGAPVLGVVGVWHQNQRCAPVGGKRRRLSHHSSMSPHREPRWRWSASTQSSPRGSLGRSRTRNIVAPPITSTSRSGSTSTCTSPRSTASANRVRTATNTSVKRLHHPRVEVGVGGHVGDQPWHRRAHHRTGEHVAGGRDHRLDIGCDVAGRRLDRGRRRRKRGLVNQLGLARPPPVQRGLGGACPLCDGGHGEVRIPDFHKQIRRGAQYGSVDTRIPGPPRARGLVNR